jgi:hypothetical protein
MGCRGEEACAACGRPEPAAAATNVGQRRDAGPTCAGCSACCYYEGIPVDKKRDKRHLPHLKTERNVAGELVLQRRADGACVHLGERGCTVYEQRPAICRSFDCRAFAAMGIVEHCAPGHQTPGWEFAAE